MNKVELINAMADNSGLSTKDCEAALGAFTKIVTDTLSKRDSVQLVGFGTFCVSERAARDAKNPSTGETVHVEATTVPKFKAGSKLKDIVNA